MVRRDDADEILGVDVGVEQDGRGSSRESSAERRLADADGAGDDQQGRSDEGALVAATRAAQHVVDRGNQLGEDAPASAGLARERHTADDVAETTSDAAFAAGRARRTDSGPGGCILVPRPGRLGAPERRSPGAADPAYWDTPSGVSPRWRP